MKNILTFNVTIAAARPLVWEVMLGVETYKKWAAVFCEGTYFEGSWDQDSRIYLLAPNGDGMVAEIAENRPLEYISIRHLGEIKDGVEDTTSKAVQTWAPAYENYAFAETKDGTIVTVEIESLPEYEQSMLEIYPKALSALKELCESN